MINFEKIKYKKCQPPPFIKTCPCTILLPPFKNFSDSPPPFGEGIKIYSPFFKGLWPTFSHTFNPWKSFGMLQRVITKLKYLYQLFLWQVHLVRLWIWCGITSEKPLLHVNISEKSLLFVLVFHVQFKRKTLISARSINLKILNNAGVCIIFP